MRARCAALLQLEPGRELEAEAVGCRLKRVQVLGRQAPPHRTCIIDRHLGICRIGQGVTGPEGRKVSGGGARLPPTFEKETGCVDDWEEDEMAEDCMDPLQPL